MLNYLGILALLCGIGAGFSGCVTDGSDRPVARALAQAAPPSAGPVKALAAANALRARGELEAALSLLEAAHARFPGHAAIASAYGRLALLAGREALAATLLRAAVAADPADWRALSALGVLEHRHGRGEQSRRMFADVNAMSANNSVGLNNLAVGHLLEGRPDRAEALLRRALAASDPAAWHQPQLRRNLALALAVQGRFEEADTVAGEPLPRDLAGADPARLRRLTGLDGAVAAGSGWTAELADLSRRAAPAVR